MNNKENSVPENIKKALEDAFPERVKFDFEHSEACNGQLGLQILIVSDEFVGVKLLERHR